MIVSCNHFHILLVSDSEPLQLPLFLAINFTLQTKELHFVLVTLFISCWWPLYSNKTFACLLISFPVYLVVCLTKEIVNVIHNTSFMKQYLHSLWSIYLYCNKPELCQRHCVCSRSYSACCFFTLSSVSTQLGQNFLARQRHLRMDLTRQAIWMAQ